MGCCVGLAQVDLVCKSFLAGGRVSTFDRGGPGIFIFEAIQLMTGELLFYIILTTVSVELETEFVAYS